MADTQTPQTEQARTERTHGGVSFTPRVDIYETEKELVLQADLPGVRPEDVDLRYEQGELMLYGKVPVRHRGRTCLLNEYQVGNFYRAFAIHESIDASKISAECKNGVLTVHLPKAEAVRPRQINVTTS
jgi:HSP20 family protein